MSRPRRAPRSGKTQPPESTAPAGAGYDQPGAPFQLSNAAIERALLTGEHTGLLQRYFGDQRYLELQQLARAAAARSVRQGPPVWILPGMMGSRLGTPRNLIFDDVIWIDPIEIARGRLLSLAIGRGRPPHQVLGVILLAYLELKLRLRLAGFDANFFPYDWRLDIRQAAKHLAVRLAQAAASEVLLVAHSLGGLVARAAMKLGAPKIGRLILLGSPNYGSFAPIQALRGIYPPVRKLALLDLEHGPETLSERVFNSFPSLYQLLPAPGRFAALDLYREGTWPDSRPLIRPRLLEAGRRTQGLLAPPDERVYLIAGTNQETITGVERAGDQFLFSVAKSGDGTVPLELALLPDVPTYYIEESHGSLAGNSRVIRAVVDLLDAGTSRALPQTAGFVPSDVRILSEESVRLAVPDARETPLGAAVPDRDVRHLLDELVAPGAVREPGDATAARRPQPSPPIVIGRRIHRRLDVRLALGSITEVRSAAYVLGVFRGVTPSGPARAIDERLDGAIAELNRRRMFSGNAGEIFMLPAGSPWLRSNLVVLAGLGPFDRFTGEVLQTVAENVIRTFVITGVTDFATVLIGGGSGTSVESSVRNLMTGFLRGLLDSDRQQEFRRVTLCQTDPGAFAAMKQELYRLASTELFREVEVTFQDLVLPAAPAMPQLRQGLPAPAEAPCYLIVRHDPGGTAGLEFQAALLTAGHKAAVISTRKRVTQKRLEAMLRRIGSPGFTFERLESFGAELAQLLFHRDLEQVLAQLKPRHLVVVHDARTSRIPWETLRLGNGFPALEAGLSRRYLTEDLSIAKWLEERRQNPNLHILLVVNPTGDLDGAEAEGRRIRELFGAHPGVQITERRRQDARKSALLDDFHSGKFDVLHYAGHAFFTERDPASSGIVCHQNEILAGQDLDGLASLPGLIFFNACEAGRIRRGKTPKSSAAPAGARLAQTAGLAEAFLRGGAANYLGTYWPVGDLSATRFAEVFYAALLRGATLAAALLEARHALHQLKSIDWADYIHFGNPEFILKPGTDW